MLPDQGPVVVLGGLDDALRGESTGAEGRHEGAVLAPQHHYVGVGLLEVVVELGQQRGFVVPVHLGLPFPGKRSQAFPKSSERDASNPLRALP